MLAAVMASEADVLSFNQLRSLHFVISPLHLFWPRREIYIAGTLNPCQSLPNANICISCIWFRCKDL